MKNDNANLKRQLSKNETTTNILKMTIKRQSGKNRDNDKKGEMTRQRTANDNKAVDDTKINTSIREQFVKLEKR